MKKIFKTVAVFSYLLIGLSACYSDEGNYDYKEPVNIQIETASELYVTQFKTLEVKANVTLDGNDESNYEYTWRIWSNDPDIACKKEIAKTKDLSYTVGEVPGSYSLILTVHNKLTGVNVYKEIKLYIQGNITEGWMVLNERDGKTDFDLIMTPFFSDRVTEDITVRNVYESVNNESLDGRGVKIGSYFALGRYQFVTILTDKGGVRLDAIKMQKAFDISTLLRDGKPWKPQNYVYWNYYWSPGRDGYDVIISDGRFYEYSPISNLLSYYTEPILRDGRTYKSASYCPKWFDYHQGIIFDELKGGFVSVSKNTFVLQDMPEAGADQMFDWNYLNGSLLYMDTGFNKWDYGLIKDWSSNNRILYAFNFDSKSMIAKGKWPLDNCPEIEQAKFYAIGNRGPIFYYATDANIYLYDYQGTNTAQSVYTAKSGEKITGMKLLKPYVDRYVINHTYDCKVLVVATYNENSKKGKIYMYYVNESNGVIDMNSEKVFTGFGEILDMEYNWAKFVS